MNFSSLRSTLAALLLGLAAGLVALPAAAQETMVRLHTTQGPIDFRLLDDAAPATVANFLAYVRGGDYTDVFFHRSARLADGTPFVIQAGGFKWTAGSSSCCQQVTSRGTVVNEFSANRSNLRGTVAMAKTAAGPNTATNQWFINMNNNAANLDNQNGGFTVFARVTAPGMVVADKIAALTVVNGGGVYNELPVANYTAGSVIQRDNLVRINQVTTLPAQGTQSDFDRVANYLEAAYPQYLSPSVGQAGTFDGYTYRYYSGSNAYVGARDGKVYYLVPSINANINELGTVADWLATAQTAGY